MHRIILYDGAPEREKEFKWSCLYFYLLHTFQTMQCTEVRFASFLTGGFTTMAVLNPPERKLSKRTSMQCTAVQIYNVMVERCMEGRYFCRTCLQKSDREKVEGLGWIQFS